MTQRRPVAGECGVPALSASSDGNVSGPIARSELPWSTAPPESLATLWRLIAGPRLMSAFRIPLGERTGKSGKGVQNIVAATGFLRGTVIEPGETVSIIGLTGPFTRLRGYTDEPDMGKVATALYNVAVYGGLTITERHPHPTSVHYICPGRDAALEVGGKDVGLRNGYDKPILLWTDVDDGALFAALYGDCKPPTVQWHHHLLNERKAPVQRRLNNSLPAGTERIAVPGKDGKTVRTSVTLTFPGVPPVHRQLSVDTYAPLPATVEYGPTI